LFFKNEHRNIPDNQGEKRESLVILEKVGMKDGLIKCLGTEQETGIIGDHGDIIHRQTFFGKNDKKPPRMITYLALLKE
jgi:hypothetical protein